MNHLMKFGLFSGYVVASVSGLAILRQFLPRIASPLRTRVPIEVRAWLLLGAFLYLLSFALWLLILRTVPLVVAYPVAVGLTICGTTLVGILVLREQLDLRQALGIALVLIGVVCISHTR